MKIVKLNEIAKNEKFWVDSEYYDDKIWAEENTISSQRTVWMIRIRPKVI